MKRSRHIGLTLLASLSLVACDSEGPPQPTQRAVYEDRLACVADWGDEDDCEDDGAGHWHGPHYYYHSGRPYYYKKKSGTAMPVPEAAGFSRVGAGTTSPRAVSTLSSSVKRGGFGGSSSSHGASS